MAKLNWSVVNETTFTTVTSDLVSAQWSVGRQSAFDSYSGQQCQFVVKNDNNQSSKYSLNNLISFTAEPTTGNKISMHFFVSGIEYEDTITGKGSLATITCDDVFARIGRTSERDYVLAQKKTGLQAEDFNASSGGDLFAPLYISAKSNGQSTASGVTYSGSILDRLNLLAQTENGLLIPKASRTVSDQALMTLDFWTRDYISTSSFTTAFSYGRSSSATQIVYDTFQRIKAGQGIANRFVVTPEGLATVTRTDTTSKATYGVYSRDVSTVDVDLVQARALGDYLARSFSDPELYRFIVSYTDVGNNSSALAAAKDIFGAFNLTYRLPSDSSDTTKKVIVEGYDVEIEPDQTRFTVYLSDLYLYQYFTLNNSTFGILNTSRLGW